MADICKAIEKEKEYISDIINNINTLLFSYSNK